MAAAVPSGAEAARGLATGFYAREYGSSDESVRDRWFDATVQANAAWVRLEVLWKDIAATQPANPRDPSDPSYNFSGLDRATREARERGLNVLFTVNRAPAWAEGPNRPPDAPPGTWNPDPVAYGDFAHALATRYSGAFPDPNGSGLPLPRVSHYEAWTESNVSNFFGPQWAGGKASSPTLFRRLLNSFYAGVKAVHGDNLVIAPALAPYGDPPGGPRVRPLKFLRDFFCLKGRREPRPKKGCKKSELPRLDIFSHHPINLYGPPTAGATHPDDASSGDLDRIKRILRAAEKARHIKPRGRHPLWVSEFFWYSNPPTESGAPLAVQARWLAESLYLHWKAGVQVSINFLIRDASDPGIPPYGTGVFLEDGTPKPAFEAFRFPFVAERLSKRRVRAWGRAPATGELEIQREDSGGWTTIKRLSVSDGAVFTTSLRVRGGANLRAVIGSDQSLAWNLAG